MQKLTIDDVRKLAEQACGTSIGSAEYQSFMDAMNPTMLLDLTSAAQPQGEPVAWQYRVSAGPQTGWSLWHDGKGEEFKQSYQVETRPLYAERPAPVAVGTVKMNGDMKCIAFGDDEWKALNVGDIIFTTGARVDV